MLTRQQWEQEWAHPEMDAPWRTEKVAGAVREAVEDGWLTPGTTLLDIGCGAGEQAAWLAEQGFRVLGIDFSSAAIERAKSAYAGRPGLHFQVLDVFEDGGLEGRFDAILDRGCFHGLEIRDAAGYVRKVTSWTRPGTRFLLLMHFKTSELETMSDTMSRLWRAEFEMGGVKSTSMEGGPGNDPLPGAAFRLIRRPTPGDDSVMRKEPGGQSDALPAPLIEWLNRTAPTPSTEILLLDGGDSHMAELLEQRGHTVTRTRASVGWGEPIEPDTPGPFKLVIDSGVLAALPAGGRIQYALRLAALADAGAHVFLMLPVARDRVAERMANLQRLFEGTFRLEHQLPEPFCFPHLDAVMPGLALMLLREDK